MRSGLERMTRQGGLAAGLTSAYDHTGVGDDPRQKLNATALMDCQMDDQQGRSLQVGNLMQSPSGLVGTRPV